MQWAAPRRLVLFAAILFSLANDKATAAPRGPEGLSDGRTTTFVVRIRSSNVFGPPKIGHGICLDYPCVNVLTNYHVAAFIGRAKVEGVRIEHSVYATGPLDPAAAPIPVIGTIQRFDPQRDLALLTLERPLPPQYGAATFSTYSPVVGQPVHRLPTLAYQRNSGSLRHAGILRLFTADHSTHYMHSVLLADFNSPQGTSGGALCDQRGAVLGIISQQDGSLALPVSVISEFLRREAPVLATRLNLPELPTVSAQPEVRDILERAEVKDTFGLTTEESQAAVRAVRKHAEEQLRTLDHVLAEASYFTPGCRVRKYQIVLLGSDSTFREIEADGTVGVPTPPPQNRSCLVEPGTPWEVGLRGITDGIVGYEGQVVRGGAIRHLFRVQRIECRLSQWLRGNKTVETKAEDCGGEVETDELFMPTRMRWVARFTPAENKWTSSLANEMTLQTFDLGKAGRLTLPVRFQFTAKARRWWWDEAGSAAVLLGNFRPFGAEHRIVGAFGSDHRIVGVDDEEQVQRPPQH
jgi:hypothetical protein